MAFKAKTAQRAVKKTCETKSAHSPTEYIPEEQRAREERKDDIFGASASASHAAHIGFASSGGANGESVTAAVKKTAELWDDSDDDSD